ncbi:putative lipid-transfer protein DIR1 [Oryza brachyantha]|uniref:putative lipid-transfer protein DIR1 n=1 Tax=Oryza brachyantha TaxID=4533 RepID=UPI001ADB9144|nr:putative lipid-transfer protein DIR1 [Oryza brachyantha]
MAKAHAATTTTAAAVLAVAVILAASAGLAHGVCNLSDAGLEACKPAAAVRNPTDTPSSQCCAALASADLPCLCRYKGSAAARGWMRLYGVDLNRAMTLPGKCGLTLPARC